jgi:FSR family fosmidomycin resistance protein-like MFS transporter
MNQKNKFQSGNVILISLTHFVHDVYSSFLAPILPLLIEKLSMSYAQAGFLTVIQRLPSLLNPIVGILADKISVKLFVILSPAITVIVMSLLGLATNYIFLSALLLIMGISASMFHVPAPVMIKQIAADRVGKGMSFFMLGGELARSVGPLVIIGAVSVWGLEGTYKLIPFGMIASLFLYFRFRNINPPQQDKNLKNRAALNVLTEYKSLLITIFGILFFTSIIKGTITTFLTVYLTDQGESLWYAGASLSIFQLAGAGGTFFSGTLSDTMGRRKVLILASVLNPILLLMFVYASGMVSVILLLLLGLFLFAFTPVLLAIINESKTEFPTFLNGIFMTINFLTSAVTISIIGFSADYFGLETTYLASALAGFICIPFVFKIKS